MNMQHRTLSRAGFIFSVTVSACRPDPAPAPAPAPALAPAPTPEDAGHGTNDPCEETWYPVQFVHGAPYLQLQIGAADRSKQGWFLLDTGSNTSDIDPAWAGSLIAPATDGYVTVEQLVFVYEQKLAKFHPTNLSMFARIRGQEQEAGILGTDFISEFSMELDLRSARAGFVRQADRPRCIQHWAELEEINILHYDIAPRPDGPRNIPSVSANIDDVTFEAQLDTGTISEFDVKTGVDAMESWIIGNEALLKSIGKEWTSVRTIQTTVTSGSFTASIYKRTDGKPIKLSVGTLTYELDYIKIEPDAAGYPLTLRAPVAVIGMPVLRQLAYLQVDPVDHKLRVKRRQ